MKIQWAQITYKKLATALLLACCCMILPSFKPNPTPSGTKKTSLSVKKASSGVKKPSSGVKKKQSPSLPTKQKPANVDNSQENHQEGALADNLADTLSDNVADTLAIPLLTKPLLLHPIPFASPDPLSALDQLMTKQVPHTQPYIPFVQEISIGMECISLLRNSWNLLKNIKKNNPNQPYEYAGNLAILFRNNVQLSVEGGYAKLYPNHRKDNRNKYSTNGSYGSIGLDYVTRYSSTDNLYAGLRYSRAYFTNHTLPDQTATQSISQKLTASWFELVLGSETLLVNKLNLYGGCTLHIGYLYNFEPFSSARNYEIPGYGINTNQLNLVLNLHILYKFSFIERMIEVN